MQRRVGKLRRSTAVADRERYLGKSASLSKHLSLVVEDLYSTLNALAPEIKEELSSK